KEDEAVKSRLKIHLVGEYLKEELLELKDLIDRGIIVLQGFVEKRKSLAFQRAAHVLLIITPPDRRSATSTKIFEYLYAGKPVLALTHKTVLEDIVNETKSGWLVHPHQPDAIANLLKRIITDPEFYNAVKPDREKIDAYSVKGQLARLHRLLEEIET
ncbi:MAG: glycosyltransferase family 4 protein, partial [bacterium]|nr:glycosyltransferase family 4 protein [bacterium]